MASHPPSRAFAAFCSLLSRLAVFTASIAIFSAFFVGSLFAFEHLYAKRVNINPDYDLRERHVVLRERKPGFFQRVGVEYADGRQGMTDFSVDEDGFVRPSRVHGKPDLSLVFIGGSTTETMFVAEDKRFPFLVGRKLEQATGLKINSYNGGVAGNHSMNSNVAVMAKAIPLRPRFLIYMDAVNDLTALTNAGSYWATGYSRSLVAAEDRVALLEYLARWTRNEALPYTIAIANWAWHNRIRPILGERSRPVDEFANVRGTQFFEPERFLSEFGHSLDTLIAITRAWDIEPILMTQFNQIHPDKPYNEFTAHQEIEWVNPMGNAA